MLSLPWGTFSRFFYGQIFADTSFFWDEWAWVGLGWVGG